MKLIALVALGILGACPATGADADFRAMLETGFPCPVRTPSRDVMWERGEAPQPTLSRSEDPDLTHVQWMGLHADPVTEIFPIVVDDGTAGLVIRADSRDESHIISVELFDPEGQLIACEACTDAPVVGEAERGRGTTQMPSTNRAGWELTPGRYGFRVRATPVDGEGSSIVDVRATLVSEAPVGMQPFLDLNFVYLPGSGLSVDIAESSPEFAALLEMVDVAMEPTGIRIGEITHHDLPDDGFSVIATWEEAGDMFLTSEEMGEPRALNVYCVEGFEAPLNPAVGLSGGIPGSTFNGTRDSGVAIRTPPLFSCSECLDAFGSLFAHEIGHYLGLYHTTEANLVNEDPFSDTPRCDAAGLRDCPDWYYVMFPVIHPANRLWSPGQATVVRTHPYVYAAPVVGQAPPTRRPRPPVAAASPNPFRERVELRMASGTDLTVARAAVYDVTGRRIRSLRPSAGAFSWDGRDDRGVPVPGGVYFARLVGAEGARTLRVVKVR